MANAFVKLSRFTAYSDVCWIRLVIVLFRVTSEINCGLSYVFLINSASSCNQWGWRAFRM